MLSFIGLLEGLVNLIVALFIDFFNFDWLFGF